MHHSLRAPEGLPRHYDQNWTTKGAGTVAHVVLVRTDAIAKALKYLALEMSIGRNKVLEIIHIYWIEGKKWGVFAERASVSC